jgi:hypothetical protein
MDTNQTPLARFEPIEVDIDECDSVPTVPRNTFRPATSTTSSSGGQNSTRSSSSYPANPVLPLLNIMDPFIGINGNIYLFLKNIYKCFILI